VCAVFIFAPVLGRERQREKQAPPIRATDACTGFKSAIYQNQQLPSASATRHAHVHGVHTHTHIIHTQTHSHTHTHTYTYTHMRTNIHTHAYTQTYTHARRRTHTRIHAHILLTHHKQGPPFESHYRKAVCDGVSASCGFACGDAGVIDGDGAAIRPVLAIIPRQLQAYCGCGVNCSRREGVGLSGEKGGRSERDEGA
jgi:hypothetical protein